MPMIWCPRANGWLPIYRRGFVRPAIVRLIQTMAQPWRGTSWRECRASPTTSTYRNISWTRWAWRTQLPWRQCRRTCAHINPWDTLYEDGAFQVFPEYIGQWMALPAGGMGASATDMARFMIAHLQDGRYSDANIAEARILEESTAQQMHSTLFTHDPRLLGTAYGFFDFSDNGQRTIGHSGEAEPMHSLLLLLPDQKLGIFVAYNSLGGWGTDQSASRVPESVFRPLLSRTCGRANPTSGGFRGAGRPVRGQL